MKKRDLDILKSASYIDWNSFKNKTVYITGATGLIGSALTKAFLSCSKAKVVIQVRNKDKAVKMFGDKVNYVVADSFKELKYKKKVNYIIHCAGPTSSKFFVENPVETINSIVNGTLNILNFAKKKNVESLVFLSTMEVYGSPNKPNPVNENTIGTFSPYKIRNCYPISKQLCENLCITYASEYGLNTHVIRLAQTFGPGVNYDDGRVFAEFARCAIEKRDIVLKTKGETKRDYLYTIDAVTAISIVLLKGKKGEIYNAANKKTFCSIYNMAKIVSKIGNINVVIKEEQDISKYGYADTTYLNLDTKKIRKLGWCAKVGIEDMYYRLIEDMASTLHAVEP